MRVFVAYKWAPDPADATVGPDGTIDFSRARPAIGEYDAVAFEVGRLLADAAGAELIGLTVGGPEAGTPAARKAALARGLDSLVVAARPDLDGLDALATATVLAGLLHAGPGAGGTAGEVLAVLTGDSSRDAGAHLVGPALAGVLGWPCLAGVRSVEARAGALRVLRRARGGTQTVALPPPAVLACAPDAAEPRVPGMRDLLAASRKPVVVACPAAPRETLEMIARRRPPAPQRLRRVIDGADADAAAAWVVAELRASGVLPGAGA